MGFPEGLKGPLGEGHGGPLEGPGAALEGPGAHLEGPSVSPGKCRGSPAGSGRTSGGEGVH